MAAAAAASPSPAAAAAAPVPVPTPGRLTYPEVAKGDVVEELHGVRVADPYRWLEDPDAPATRAFVEAQNGVTSAYFRAFGGSRAALRERLTALQNYERVGCPYRRGDAWYIHRNTGLQNQDVLLRLAAGSGGDAAALPDGAWDTATPLLDLNAEFPAGTTSLGSSSFSEDGRYFAYGLATGGSDWQTLYVREAATGRQLADVVPWTKFTSIAWTHDNAGFFYSRHPAPPTVAGGGGAASAGTETAATTHCMVAYHVLGTDAAEDVLVYADPANPVWRFGVEVTDDGAYLLLSTRKGTDPVSRLYYAHLPSVWAAWRSSSARPLAVPPGGVPPAADAYPYLPLVRPIDNFEAEYDYVANDGPHFVLRTNLAAPNYRLVNLAFPPDAPHTPSPASGAAADGATPAVTDAVAADGEAVLDWAVAVGGDVLMACYMRDVCNEVAAFRLDGSGAGPLARLWDVPCPPASTIVSFSGRRDQDVACLKFVSPLLPGATTRLALGSGPHTAGAPPAATQWYATRLPGFDPADYEASRHFVPLPDGTPGKLPVFVVRKRPAGGAAAAAAGPAPTLLYGYGGFNVSLQPTFSAIRLAWLGDVGGVFVLACLRGGGEYGEAWHVAGSRLNKQNVFNDLAAVASWLVETGITTPRRLGVMGGSNGGLLALACALQWPARFGAAVAQVPVADMLRFHKFTVGALWRGEYGYTEDSADDFANVMRYSPLHNVRAPPSLTDQLPSILITTADHDDRVVPLHSMKMVAQLQAVAGASPLQRRPLLVRVDVNAGHGAGKPTSMVLDEYADIYAFLAHELTRTDTP